MKGFEHVPPIIDVPGVADLLGVSVEEARRLIGEGWVPSTTVGGRVLCRRDEVIAWLRGQRIEPPPESPV